MNLPELSVRRPVTIMMAVLIIILLGVVSLTRLPIDLLPNMKFPIAAVMASYPGAGPQEIETLVTKPLEEVMGTTNNVKNIYSYTQSGQSIVVVEYNWGTDMDQATLQMREKIDLIKGTLPEDVGTPTVFKFDPQAIPVMYLAVTGSSDLASLKQLADDMLKSRIERLDGVASVSVNGGLEREIRISVQPGKLQAYGFSLAQVSQALKAENLNLPGGKVRDGRQELIVRTTGEFQDIDEIGNIMLTSPQGTQVFLRDLALIEDTYKDVSRINRVNGKQSISLVVQKQSDANTVRVNERILKELEEIKAQLPADVEIIVAQDLSIFIKKSINNLVKEAVVGAFFAICVLYLFLQNIRSTFIISTAIPFSIISTFTLLYFAGVTLNLMSLGGLALGVGMLVDYSIVVLESIYRFREEGYSQTEAAIKGASEVGMAITASTLTSMAVFLPIVFVEGLAAQIFGELALTVAFSHLASLIVALTLIPMLSSKILKIERSEKVRENSWRDRLFNRWQKGFSKVEVKYRDLLSWALGHRKKVVLIAVASFVVSLALIPFIGAEFIPASDEGEFKVEVKLPNGALLDDTAKIVGQIETIVSKIPETDTVFVQVGSAGEGGAELLNSSNELGEVSVRLVPQSERNRSVDEVVEEVRNKVKNIAGAKITVTATQQMGMSTGGKPIAINLKGDDLETLVALAEDVKARVEKVEGTREVSTSLEEGKPEVQLIIDRQKAAAYGFNVSQIAAAVKTAIQGEVATKYRVDGNEYDVTVRLQSGDRDNLTDLEQVMLTSSQGVQMPLAELAEFKEAVGPNQITRENQARVVTVNSAISGRDLQSVTKDIQAALANLKLPQGYLMEFGGENKEMIEAFSSLALALVLAMILVYMIMAAEFESLLHPFVIMFTVPLALIGITLSLVVTGKSFSVVAFIGVIMLVGIVVSNAIVLVDYINILRRRGLTREEAILKAGPVRLRPIIMTTLTTTLGLVPIALGIGEGAEVTSPLAIVVVGGLIFSTLLTLVVIPTFYTIFDDKAEKWKGKFRGYKFRAGRKTIGETPQV